MDPLTIAALAMSFIGNATAGASVEQENKRRMERIAKHLQQRKMEALNSGIGILSKQKASSIAQAGGDAEMRAIAMGRGNDVEGFVQPQVSKIASSADVGMNQFITNTNQQFENALTENEMNYANRPIQPGAGQYLGVLGAGVSKYAQQENFMKRLEGLYSKYGIQGGGGLSEMPTGIGSPMQDLGVSDYSERFG